MKFKKSKGPLTLRSFLSNLSCNTVARQVNVAGELCSITWVVSQYYVALRVARSRTQQRIASTGNTTERCITPPATFLTFYTAVLTKAHAHTSRFSPSGSHNFDSL